MSQRASVREGDQQLATILLPSSHMIALNGMLNSHALLLTSLAFWESVLSPVIEVSSQAFISGKYFRTYLSKNHILIDLDFTPFK